MLEEGKAAPDFTLSDQHGNSVSLKKLKGKPIVLYFYPEKGSDDRKPPSEPLK